MSQIYNKKQRGNYLFSLVHDTEGGGSEPAHLDLLLSFSIDGSVVKYPPAFFTRSAIKIAGDMG